MICVSKLNKRGYELKSYIALFWISNVARLVPYPRSSSNGHNVLHLIYKIRNIFLVYYALFLIKVYSVKNVQTSTDILQFGW